MVNRLVVVLSLVALLLLTVPAAQAVPIVEVGDAGDLQGTAQTVDVNAVIDSISGTIGNNGLDVDVYRIFIFDPAAFSANANATTDEMLWLFDGIGAGVYSNDDPGILPSGAANGPAAPGEYLLAISRFPVAPLTTATYASDADLVFLPPPFTLDHTLVQSPQSALPLVSWYDYDLTGGPSNGRGGGTYTIALTGARGVLIPEPASLSLLGLGLLAVARRRRR